MAKDFFVSYTRSNSAELTRLLKGLQKLHHRVWLDQDLDGGQQWWDEVLNRIRSCDCLLLALTPAALESTACLREVEYAQKLGKPILPVMLERVSADLLPMMLAPLQMVDFTKENDQGIFDLVGALERLPEAPPAPDALPEPPPVPISYLSGLGERVQAPTLTLDEQYVLLGKMKVGLDRPREREAVLQLMGRMRSRDDIYAGPAKELDALFAGAGNEQAGLSLAHAAQPPKPNDRDELTIPMPTPQPPPQQTPPRQRPPQPPPPQSPHKNGPWITAVTVLVIGLVAVVALVVAINRSASTGSGSLAVASQAAGSQAAPAPASPDVTTPAPTSAAPPQTACDSNVSAGPDTSCPFALNVAQAYQASGGGNSTISAFSPVTGLNYTMTCTSGSPTVCTGGNNAIVYIH
jgi:hypothetical protein